MTWQVILAFLVTIPALLIAIGFLACVFHHRYKVFKFTRQQYLAGPRHIDHPLCKCQCCIWEREVQVIME